MTRNHIKLFPLFNWKWLLYLGFTRNEEKQQQQQKLSGDIQRQKGVVYPNSEQFLGYLDAVESAAVK